MRTESRACTRDTDGNLCDDGLPCTDFDVCSGGYCQSGYDYCGGGCICTPLGCMDPTPPYELCASSDRQRGGGLVSGRSGIAGSARLASRG